MIFDWNFKIEILDPVMEWKNWKKWRLWNEILLFAVFEQKFTIPLLFNAKILGLVFLKFSVNIRSVTIELFLLHFFTVYPAAYSSGWSTTVINRMVILNFGHGHQYFLKMLLSMKFGT